MDGHFGTNNALQMVRQCGLHLTSKLRVDSALYFQYDGPYAGRGAPKKYGAKLDYACIPDTYRQDTVTEKGCELTSIRCRCCTRSLPNRSTWL